MKRSMNNAGQAIAPKLPYPADDDRGTKAAKRRRLFDIKDEARGCLALYDVLHELKREIGKMELLKFDCVEMLHDREKYLQELCESTTSQFFPGGRYGPKDPDEEEASSEHEYDSEELIEKTDNEEKEEEKIEEGFRHEYDSEGLLVVPVGTPPLPPLTDAEEKMLDENVLKCMQGWQAEGTQNEERREKEKKEQDVLKKVTELDNNHQCITCEWPLSKNCRCCERTFEQYWRRKTEEKKQAKKKPEMPGFLPGVRTANHVCDDACRGKVHLL